MDFTQFSANKTGHLVPITTVTGENDFAFIPRPMPPEWVMARRLWPSATMAHRVIGELNGISHDLRNPRLLLQPLQQREALRSSRLENTYATPEQLLLFESRGRPDPKTEEEAAWLEVHNYYEALKHGYDRMSDGGAFDTALICDLHAILLQRARGRDRSPGLLRTGQVYVGHPGDSRRYIPPPPEEMNTCLDAFKEYTTGADDDLDPLVRAYVVHYQFEAIHPFFDGNGRIGRLLLSLLIHHWLFLDSPWLYMSEFFERTKDEYKDRLFRVSANGEWDEWIEYCLRGTIEQAVSSAKLCHALIALKRQYRKKMRGRSKRAPDIIDRLFATPIIRVVDVEDQFDCAYETAKTEISKLMDAGILREIAHTRPKTFLADEICRLAYGDPADPPEGSQPAA